MGLFGQKKTSSGACAPLCHADFILVCRAKFLILFNTIRSMISDPIRDPIFDSIRDGIRDPFRDPIRDPIRSDPIRSDPDFVEAANSRLF